MANFRKISILQAKIGYLQLFLGKLFYFSKKSHHFRTYFLYMIRYIILRPVHDPPATPTTPPAQNLGGRDPPPTPPGLMPMYLWKLYIHDDIGYEFE